MLQQSSEGMGQTCVHLLGNDGSGMMLKLTSKPQGLASKNEISLQAQPGRDLHSPRKW